MRPRRSGMYAVALVMLLSLVAGGAAAQDLIFADDFEWGSICAWSNLWFPDVDNDSFGDETAAGFSVSCPAPDFSAVNRLDCVDTAPMVNPGALEIATGSIDDDCDGEIDEVDTVCSEPFHIGDADPMNGAKSIELCQSTSAGNPRWGVLRSAYVRANGDPYGPSAQFGLLASFGVNFPVSGERLLGLSTGYARDTSSGGGCGSEDCSAHGSSPSPGTPPPGFPQSIPSGCPVSDAIIDDVGFEVSIRAPTNVTGLSFRYSFFSFDWSCWVCTEYVDQFVVLMDPPPPGSINGNIASDIQGTPISVNSAYLEACDPGFYGEFASQCTVNCPSLPNPYCPLGDSRLEGTGFLEWWFFTLDNPEPGGATPWIEVTAPVTPGEDFTLRFVIWDAVDTYSDSTVLIDAFEWTMAP